MQCTFLNVILIVLPIVTSILGIIIAALCGKYLAILLPYFFYGEYAKSTTTLILALLIERAVGVIFLIIDLIYCLCKKASIKYLNATIDYIIVVGFIISIVIYVRVTAKLKISDDIEDTRTCSKFYYFAYESSLKDAGNNRKRIIKINDFFDNLVWNDFCKGGVTPILVVEIILLIVTIIWGIFSKELFGFSLSCLNNVECLNERKQVSNKNDSSSINQDSNPA